MRRRMQRRLVLCALLLAMCISSGCDGGQDTLSSATATPVGSTPGSTLALDPAATAEEPTPEPTPSPALEPLWIVQIEGAEVASLTSHDFNVLPQTGFEIEGATYSGVLLMDVLTHLKLAPGAFYEVANAFASVTLGPDQILTPETLLANTKNGEPIDPPEGPLLLVVGGDFDLWMPGVAGLKPGVEPEK